MNFGHAAVVEKELVEAGYVFTKRIDDGWWQVSDDAQVVMVNRSKGDLLRSFGKEVGVW